MLQVLILLYYLLHSVFVAREQWNNGMESMVSDGEETNGQQQETPNVILALRRILEDMDPLTTTKNSIIQTLCDECGEEFRLLFFYYSQNR